MTKEYEYTISTGTTCTPDKRVVGLLLFIDFEYMFSMCELSEISYISHLPGVIRIEISWGAQLLPIP